MEIFLLLSIVQSKCLIFEYRIVYISLFLSYLIYCFQGKVSGSVPATDRLMKELKNIYKSDSFKARKIVNLCRF